MPWLEDEDNPTLEDELSPALDDESALDSSPCQAPLFGSV